MVKKNRREEKEKLRKKEPQMMIFRSSFFVVLLIVILMSTMILPTQSYHPTRSNNHNIHRRTSASTIRMVTIIRGGAEEEVVSGEEILLSNSSNKNETMNDAEINTILTSDESQNVTKEVNQNTNDNDINQQESLQENNEGKETLEATTVESIEIKDQEVTEIHTEEKESESEMVQEEIEKQPEEEEEEEEQEIVTLTKEEIIEKSIELRQFAKEYHDDGDFEKAAETFREAATVIMNTDEESAATCILHEALCFLKQQKYAQCITSCSHVLQDGIQVVYTEQKKSTNNDHDNEEEEEEEEESETMTTAVITTASTTTNTNNNVSVAVRARAHHRRAKARLALGDTSGALDDARSAAFLGDRNAVTLYGKLMRQTTSTDSSNADSGDFSMLMDQWNNNSNNNNNPFASPFLSSPSDDAGGSNALLQSLLGKATEKDGSTKETNPFSGGLFGELASAALFNNNNNSNDSSKSSGADGDNGGGGIETMAKSMVSSLTKRIEEEETQKMVCKFLNGLNEQQLLTYSSMAGISLNEKTSARIVSFAKSVTPPRIQRTIVTTKRIIKVGKIIRAISKFVTKYKHLIILFVLASWMKSAMLRPIVIKPSKKQQRNKVIKETLKHAGLDFLF